MRASPQLGVDRKFLKWFYGLWRLFLSFKSRSNVLIRLSEKQNYIHTKDFILTKILSLQKLLRSWQSFIKCNHIDQSKFRGSYVFFRIESKTNVVVAILEYFSSLDSPFLMELGNEQLLWRTSYCFWNQNVLC